MPFFHFENRYIAQELALNLPPIVEKIVRAAPRIVGGSVEVFIIALSLLGGLSGTIKCQFRAPKGHFLAKLHKV